MTGFINEEIIADGPEIGNGCVAGANTVFNKRFSDNVVIAGIPAQVVKNRLVSREGKDNGK